MILKNLLFFIRSFLYRYDYSSETNIRLPKCVATADGVDEDFVSSFSFKTLPKTEDPHQCSETEQEMLDTMGTCDTHESNVETNCNLLENGKRKDMDFNESFCFKEKKTLNDSCTEHAVHMSQLSIVETRHEFLNTHEMKDEQLSDNEAKMIACQSETERGENLTIQRAHTSPKLKDTKDSKRKNKGHRRALSLDDNYEQLESQHSPKTTQRNAVPHNTDISNKQSSDLVIVVDNSNIFIGAQECATVVNSHEKKRNIRVKIQQLVKVFQKGRVVCRAFVQGSSPPITEQVWEVYRYEIDLLRVTDTYTVNHNIITFNSIVCK